MKTNYIGEQEILKAIRASKFNVDNQGRIWRGNKRAENKTPQGYLQIRLMTNNVRHHCGAHRIVYLVKVGVIPPGLTINHKNGIKDDNRPENLELATYSQQVIHAMKILGKHQRLLNQNGEKNHFSKLKDSQIDQIRKEYSASTGVTQAMLATKYGVSFQQISRIVRGDRRGGEKLDYTHRRSHSNHPKR